MMPRDIRFRGKRVDNSKWVYGFYCQSEEFFDNGGVGHMYREGTVTLHTIFNSANETHLVDPETVGQSTGLLDKNGKEVYEGDAVKSPRYGVLMVVRYLPSRMSFVLCAVSSFVAGKRGGYSQSGINCETIEVIGNATDNPDLLKEDK